MSLMSSIVCVGQNNISDKVYDSVERMPSFPGGDNAMYQFFDKNIRYPSEAEKQQVGGSVTVEFVVERDGKISNARVVNSVSPLLNKEAVRVVKSMPRWNPGKHKGVAVRVKKSVMVFFIFKKTDNKK